MRFISRIFNLNDPGWGRNGDKKDDAKRPSNQPQGNQEGPPDLDEVWRDFNRRLSTLFGGKKNKPPRPPAGGGGRPRLPKGSPKIFLALLIAIVGLWMASGFIVVQEGQVAVVTRFGQYVRTLNPGLQWHWPTPIEASQTVNIAQLRTFEIGFRGSSRNKVLTESLMLTADESIVDVQFVVQYRLLQTGAPDYLFNTSDPDESVRQAVETAMREIVGKKPMDFVLYSGRTEVASEVQELAQSILNRYKTGIQISTVAIQNVQPPEQVLAAFDDAVKAGQDRERQINEGNAYANKVLPEAFGQVARMIQDAEGYKARVIGSAKGDAARFTSVLGEYVKSPDVMRDRLYLDTFENIMKQSSKVLVDVDGGNNMLYLPLDQITKSAASGSRSGSSESRHAAGSAASNDGSSPDSSGSSQSTSSSSSDSGRNNASSSANSSDRSLMNPYSPYSR
ncbi:MAG TPA: FtsH protease activity modulator HflK [Paenalcaligenes sp.]|nr:FtsH protease activity modulator HflK [Paenalcaligenes sp.]